MKKIVVCTLSLIVLATGGTWNYGVGITGSYSDYFHGTKRHSATVKKGSDESYQAQGAGVWTKARLGAYSGCNFYYNYW
ncbi:lactococcin 972 family bacteriocin [Enterococcus mundtii]|uniref:Lactococcin 972 family bacteriocin n=1 Tax=Enterococcus mundtii TaxID=53346 RepID=A0A2S7RTC1_ENTMU|nr:lactococcin 972 family bacteriocin [Enterococcus mundtii]PQF22952.1 lactococcin 972 family bacteriocin [Enterococcus mundtii]